MNEPKEPIEKKIILKSINIKLVILSRFQSSMMSNFKKKTF